MAHEYVDTLLAGGTDATGSTADLTLKNSFGTQLGSATGISADPKTRTSPSTGDPRIQFIMPVGSSKNTFQNSGTYTWSEPLELETKIDDGTTASATSFESFSFNAPQGPLTDGDKLTIDDFSLTYANHPGFVAIVDAGGIGSANFKFEIKDGGTVLKTKTNPVSYSGSRNSISIDSTLEFTNNSGSNWNVDGLSCQAEDSGGTYREIDDVSFTSVTVGDGSTLRFTDVTHNFNYP